MASRSGSTLWRWLHEDAIRPWYQRSWIFPRDPEFATKAGRVLDLYAREWQGSSLKEDEFVISADEKTSIPARRRKHRTQNCGPHTPMRVEHEYFRCGAWTYIAALDVHHARIFGRCEAKNGLAPFDRLVDQVMTQPPYNDARSVFWIVDNCSAHRGVKAAERLRDRYRRLTLVHAPIHAPSRPDIRSEWAPESTEVDIAKTSHSTKMKPCLNPTYSNAKGRGSDERHTGVASDQST